MAGIETDVVHAGSQIDSAFGSISFPIYQTATFKWTGLETNKGFEYARESNPTRTVLERNLAELEGGKGSIIFSSGLGAVATLALHFKAGDELIFSRDGYGGIQRLLKQVFSKFGLKSKWIDLRQAENLEKEISKDTKLVFIETPTNPLLYSIDMKAIGEICQKHSLHYCVDNTFLTPVFQKPIKFGADIVLHSLTKYLSGHNDVLGGAIVSTDEELLEHLHFLEKAVGANLGPQDSWLTLRGIKTLALRMKQHEKNALAIAKFLHEHPQVEKVYYPGLADHPGHELAKEQATGFGGMLAFEIKGGVETGKKFVKGLKLWTYGESLGGVESIVSYPRIMSHMSLNEKERKEQGISDGLIRLSTGIENTWDLVQDLEQALEKTQQSELKVADRTKNL